MGFWDPALWLPRDVPWEKLPPKFNDLIYPIYFALPLFFLRIVYESFVGIPLAYFAGYFGKKTSLPEQVFSYITGGFFQNTRQKRILECFWRFSYYLAAFIYGCVILWDKSWLWDMKQAWIGYPFHPVSDSVWWYYTIEAAFYYSLLIASFCEVRRSDFWELIIHHFVTIGLLYSSWTINFVRVGTLVLLSHDVSDWILELGKLVRYLRCWKWVINFMFVSFLISWIISRLGYYPFILIRSAVFDAAGLIQPDYDLWDLSVVPYAPRAIIFLLIALLVLHIFWTFLIVRVVIRTLTQGEAKDVRSDSDTDEDEEEVKLKKDRKHLVKKKTKNSEESSSEEEGEETTKEKDQPRRRNLRRE